jgi:hypothetical protein
MRQRSRLLGEEFSTLPRYSLVLAASILVASWPSRHAMRAAPCQLEAQCKLYRALLPSAAPVGAGVGSVAQSPIDAVSAALETVLYAQMLVLFAPKAVPATSHVEVSGYLGPGLARLVPGLVRGSCLKIRAAVFGLLPGCLTLPLPVDVCCTRLTRDRATCS